VIETAVADARQREQALDISDSFIVQAPAGSGKTELLTQRYLRLLAEVRHPEEIYAITFTRKAAAEMRNRILAALDAAKAAEPAESHRRLTWALARAALEQDARHAWQIARNPNRLRIQTFDSLSHALARQMPLLSELGAPPATTDRPEPYYQEAARATLRMLEDPTLGRISRPCWCISTIARGSLKACCANCLQDATSGWDMSFHLRAAMTSTRRSKIRLPRICDCCGRAAAPTGCIS